MKNGLCPKCGSSDVYTQNKGIYTRKSGELPAHLHINISTFSSADFDNYLCAACGYIESYVADLSDLPKIASKWKKVK